MRKYNPKAIIPAPCFLQRFDGLTTDVSGLESADGWVNEREKVHPGMLVASTVPGLKLTAAEAKGAYPRIDDFGHRFDKK